jgi:phosphoglycolate phosphatase-like HAD superfamily hydrolase
MNAKLILFDIDKTLISKTKLSRNPWKLAIESVFEVENSTGLAEIDTHGLEKA